MWGGALDRNMVSGETGLPDSFRPGKPATGWESEVTPLNIKWAARLGTHTLSTPAVAGGKVFIGTNNGTPRNPILRGDRSVLMCFNEGDGQFLWQLAAPKRKQSGSFAGDFAGLGICSSPAVDGDCVYVVTSRCEVLCLSVDGLAKGNRGPFLDEAQYLAQPIDEKVSVGPDGAEVACIPGAPVKLSAIDADILWGFDMTQQVHSWPHDACDCSILVYGDYLYVGTSNGIDATHRFMVSPNAPSLIVLNKHTGRLVAVDSANIGPRVFHGQWSSPSLGVVNGQPLIFYGGGDGFCYAFDARPQPGLAGQPGSLPLVWWCDCNPADYRVRNGRRIPYKTRGDGPCEIIATPVFHDNRVYVSIGQDPRHGPGKGCLNCIDATKTGCISDTGIVWRYRGINRSLSTVSVADGLVYAADFAGTVHCVEAETGQPLWTQDTGAPIWGSTLVADGKVFVGTEGGDLWVLQAGRQPKVLGTVAMDGPVYTTPVAANGVLYVTSEKWLYAVGTGGTTADAPTGPGVPSRE